MGESARSEIEVKISFDPPLNKGEKRINQKKVGGHWLGGKIKDDRLILLSGRVWVVVKGWEDRSTDDVLSAIEKKAMSNNLSRLRGKIEELLGLYKT